MGVVSYLERPAGGLRCLRAGVGSAGWGLGTIPAL